MKFKRYKLNDLSIDGGSYGIGASAVEYDKKLYTYLRITDINEDGTLNYKDMMSVNDPKANQYILKKNDICFVRTGNSTGKTYFYDGSIENLVYAGFLIKFSIDEEKVNPKYVKYYIMTSKYKNWVKEIQTGSTRGNINAKMYGNLEILIPERTYQDKLVIVLDKITDKIKYNTKTNDNLSNISQLIFDNYIKDNMDLEYCKISELNPKLETGKRPNGGVSNIESGIPSIGAESIKGLGYFDYVKTKYVTEEYFCKMKKGIVKGYELLIYKDGGKPGYFMPNFSMFGDGFPFEKFAINEHVFLLDFENIRFNIFAYYYFNSATIRNRLRVLGSKSAAIPGINQQDILNLEIPKLNENIDKNILDVLERNTKKIIKNSKQNYILSKLRDTLLPKLMNGEIDLDKIEI